MSLEAAVTTMEEQLKEAATEVVDHCVDEVMCKSASQEMAKPDEAKPQEDQLTEQLAQLKLLAENLQTEVTKLQENQEQQIAQERQGVKPAPFAITRRMINYFSGEESKKTVESWLQRVEIEQELYGWSVEQTFLAASGALAGSAQYWFERQSSVDTWEALKEGLLANFGKRVTAAKAHASLAKRSKRTDELMLAYVLEMERRGHEGGVPDDEVKNYIIEGVTSDVNVKMTLTNTKDRRDFVELLEYLEDITDDGTTCQQNNITKRFVFRNDNLKNVTVGGMKISAVIDSGADASIIRESAWKRIKSSNSSKYKEVKCWEQLTGFGKKSMVVKSKVDLPTVIDGNEYLLTYYITPDCSLACELIIGLPLLQYATINFAPNRLTIEPLSKV